jgi:hypothetical protein
MTISRIGFYSLLIVCLISTASGQEVQSRSCSERNKKTAQSLKKGSPIFFALRGGLSGDGRLRPWQSEMKRLKIKHAFGVVSLERKNRSLQLDIVDIILLSDYYNFNAELREGDDLEAKQQVGKLKEDLEWPILSEANSMLAGMKLTSHICGRLYVNIVDDECLPTPPIGFSDLYPDCKTEEILKTPDVKPSDL